MLKWSVIELVYLQNREFFCRLFEEFRRIVLLLKLEKVEFNRLDTEDPHNLELFGLEGIYADCVAKKRLIHGHNGK